MAKRKTGERYSNGKLKKPTAAERAKTEAEVYRANMQQVGNQPGRREFADPLDPWLESEVGRFCRRNRLRRELFEAGTEWANIKRLYRLAWGAPMDEHHGGAGSGEGPSAATVAGWKATLLNIEEALYGETGRNKARYTATMRLCLDGQPVPRELVDYAKDGLRVLAIELGKMTAKEQPFQDAA